MTAILTDVRRPLPVELERKIARARWAIGLERLWPRLWALLAVAGAFVLVSLLGLWLHLDEGAHKLTLGAFGLLALAALMWIARVAWPTREEAIRRIERVSGVPHRPASSYGDTVSATDDPSAKVLWQAHRQRLSRLLSRLRVGWPVPRTDRYDPFGLRAVLLIALAVAYAFSGDSAIDRIYSAFRFGPSAATIAQARLDVWVTPPPYTGRPPIMLADGARPQSQLDASANKGLPFEVPDGSQLVVRTSGAALGKLVLEITPDGAAARRIEGAPAAGSGDAPVQGGAEAIEIKTELKKSATVRILAGNSELGRWQFKVIPDLPPKISFAKPPEKLARGALKLTYKVEDDYGVVGIEGRLKRARPKDGDPATEWARPKKLTGPRPPHERPPQLALPLPRSSAKEAEGSSFHDLSSHPWAGTRVELSLIAKDHIGQTGRSETVELVLPIRTFRKPLARAVIEQRRMLVEDPRNVPGVLKRIEAITFAPEAFPMEAGPYMNLRSVFWRLSRDTSRRSLRTAVEQLWHIALRIEDGNLSEAERRLRDVQDRLAQALRDGASDEELRQLMQELREAMRDFLNEMARNNDGRQPQVGENSRNLTSRDLERMMRDLESMAQQGSREMAQQMLNELRDLLERLQPGGQAQNGESREMSEMMDKFGNIIGKQQQLLDDTNRQQGRPGEKGQRGQQGRPQPGERGQRGPKGQQGQGQQGQGQQGQGQQGMGEGQDGEEGLSPDGLGKRQGELRDALRRLQEQMRRFGLDAPADLDGAEQSMSEAERALREGKLGDGAQREQDALDQLRKGAQQLAEQMRQRLLRYGNRGDHAPADPLGRPQRTEGPDLGTSVHVPEEFDRERAREILEELRRRSGERGRPQPELDYIDRLLRRF